MVVNFLPPSLCQPKRADQLVGAQSLQIRKNALVADPAELPPDRRGRRRAAALDPGLDVFAADVKPRFRPAGLPSLDLRPVFVGTVGPSRPKVSIRAMHEFGRVAVV